MQRYFAGELRPDQRESWKADDGIFVFYTDHIVALAEKKEELKQHHCAFNKEFSHMVDKKNTQIAGMRENKLYLENDLAMKMEQIADLTIARTKDSAIELRQQETIESLMMQNQHWKAENKKLTVKTNNSLANNLCPDHRDKQAGKQCLACNVEHLTTENADLRKCIENEAAKIFRNENTALTASVDKWIRIAGENQKSANLSAAALVEEIDIQDQMLNPGEHICEREINGVTICVLRKDLWDIRSIGETKKRRRRLQP